MTDHPPAPPLSEEGGERRELPGKWGIVENAIWDTWDDCEGSAEGQRALEGLYEETRRLREALKEAQHVLIGFEGYGAVDALLDKLDGLLATTQDTEAQEGR